MNESVSGIILRAMRLLPSERYQGADEMLADVERVLRTELDPARELSQLDEALKRAVSAIERISGGTA